MFLDSLHQLFERGEDKDKDKPSTFQLFPNDGGQRTHSGIRVSQQGALGLSAVWAVTSKIANSVASSPCYLYKRLPDGGREKATYHPAFWLIAEEPNEEQTPFEFFRTLCLQRALGGNAYGDILLNGRGDPNEIHLLDPSKCDVERNRETGKLDYVYYNPGKTLLDRARVAHIKEMSPDGVKGMSPITQARHTIGLGLALEAFQARLIANDATPRGLLKHKDSMSQEAREKARDEWQKIYGSIYNKGRIGVITGGFEFQAMGMTLEDAQFIESRKFQIEEVARWFGIPQHMIGLLERSTNNNIEHQAMEFLRECLGAWFKCIEQALTKKLLRPRERGTYFFEFDREANILADTKTLDDALAKRVLSGQMSINEARAKRNMNPIPGGDIWLQPTSHAPLGYDPAKIKEEEQKQKEKEAETEEETDDEPEEDDKEDKERAEIVAPIWRDILKRAYRRESKATASKVKQNARRGSEQAVRDWHVEHMQEMRSLLQEGLGNTAPLMSAIGYTDPEQMIRECIDFSITRSEMNLGYLLDPTRSAFKTFEAAVNSLDNWEAERSEEIVNIFL